MMSQARNNQRVGTTTAYGVGMAHHGHAYGQYPQVPTQYSVPASSYAQLVNAQLQNGHFQSKEMNVQPGLSTAVEDLSQAMAAASLHGYGSNVSGRSTNNGTTTSLPSVQPMNSAQANNQLYYQLPDGRLILPGVSTTTQGNYQSATGAYSLTPAQAHYLQQASYHVNALPNTPHAPTWNGAQHMAKDMPELAPPRRNSFSSNEENGPHTPFYGGHHGQAEIHPSIALTGHSPETWGTGTPSPSHQEIYPQQLAKSANGQYTYCDLDALCQQDPPIPKPVPAIFSGENGRGTLAKSLQNLRSTTNVYIRGFLPDTTDEMLHAYGARFGEIISAKAMLDQNTGLCKGFGFIKYHNFHDGENCIRGFFHWGYEAKWARVSHNEKLKTLGDEDNTNLYVSNLPTSFNESMLIGVFEGYEVPSAKILRDPNGMSRGVGFARFESPAICDEIIEKYNGKLVGEEAMPLNIRYADTTAQKQLKSITAERRQFKTHEYNTSVFGAASPYLASPTSATFPSPLQTRAPLPNTFWPGQGTPLSPFSQTFPVAGVPYLPPTLSNIGGVRPSAENIAPAGRYPARVKIESPITVALAKRTIGDKASYVSPPTSPEDNEKVCKVEPDLANIPIHKQSPAKSSPSKSLVGHTGAKL